MTSQLLSANILFTMIVKFSPSETVSKLPIKFFLTVPMIMMSLHSDRTVKFFSRKIFVTFLNIGKKPHTSAKSVCELLTFLVFIHIR